MKNIQKEQNVSTRFSLSNDQIEIIADLFSKREVLIIEGQDDEWLLSHAFQLGMKMYRDLLNSTEIKQRP